MWITYTSNDDIKIVNNRKPKYKIGDIVSLRKNFIQINNNTINYSAENVNYNLFINNKILKIKEITYNTDSNIMYYMLLLHDEYQNITNEYITEEAITITIDYNEPKQLVYENLNNNNIKMIVFIVEDLKSSIDTQQLLLDNNYTPKGYNEPGINNNNIIKVIYIDILNKVFDFGTYVDFIDSNIKLFNYNLEDTIRIYNDKKTLLKYINTIMNPHKLYNEPKQLVYENVKSFNDFLFENLDVVSFIISDRLEDLLTKIEHPIAKKILEDSEKKPKSKITFLDIDDERNNYWSFVNSVKAIQYINDNRGNSNLLKDLIINKDNIIDRHKSISKIGKIILKLYNDVFDNNQIESFINEYKKSLTTNFDLIDIVKGKDINYWYNCKNYEDDDDTPLTNSCMSYQGTNKYIDFYAVNSEKVSMVILYSDNNKNKICGRALLWKPDEIDGIVNSDSYFMDRVYYNTEDNKNVLLKYAENNNWYHKIYQNSQSISSIWSPLNKNGSQNIFKIKDIKISDNHTFPYVDTLKYLNIEYNTLTNDYDSEFHSELSELHGGTDGIIWSKIYNAFMNEDDVIYAKISKDKFDYLLSKDVTYLYSNNTYYYNDFIKELDIVKVKRLDGKEYNYLKEDTLFSKKYNCYYFKNDVKFIKSCNDYLPLSELIYSNYMDEYLLLDDSVKVVVGDYHKKTGKYSVYKGENKNEVLFNYDHFLKKEVPNEIYFEYDGEYFVNDYKGTLLKNKNKK